MLSAIETAARNNAAWCDSFCRTHGIAGAFGSDRWTSTRRTPPLYPDAITLAPSVRIDTLVAEIDVASPGCSVKDSFASLDLVDAGFAVLFEAEWIRHDALVTPVDGRGTWSVVTTGADLAEWEDAWRDVDAGTAPRVFEPRLLESGSIVVLGARTGAGFDAGAIGNVSDGVVGVSNLFARNDRARAWADCVATVMARFPGAPIVGYESGADLELARRQGFASIGPLRVWLAP